MDAVCRAARDSGRTPSTAPVTQVVVIGEGAIPWMLAQELGRCAEHVAVPPAELEQLPTADCWVAVLDGTDPPGGRAWLTVTAIALAAARLDQLRSESAVPPTLVLVVPGRRRTGPPAAELPPLRWCADVRAGARRPLPPWTAEPLARGLVPQADLWTGDWTGDVATTPDSTVEQALAAGLYLVPHACWITAGDVVVPRGGVPALPSPRRGGDDRPRGGTAACTVPELAQVVSEAVGARGRVAPSGRFRHVSGRPPTAGAAVRAEASAHPQEAIPVVIPPRPERPSIVLERQQRAMWTGAVKGGNRWSVELADLMREHLDLTDAHAVLTTASGTAALRLCYETAAGRARPGDIAILPAFTFVATAESLLQLGYRLRFVDVDPTTWTMDPAALERAVEQDGPRLVVTVDALGAPCDHAALAKIASAHGVPVVADSAAALGALHRGRPVAGWQQASAFSLSFAKTLTSGGAGGIAVVPAEADLEGPRNWLRSSLMPELQAIAALDQLAVLDALVGRREAVARAYDAVLTDFPAVRRQQVRAGDRHAWVHYVILLPDRATGRRVAGELAAAGVQTKPYYAPALHDPVWAHAFDGGDGSAVADALPISTMLASRSLALPMSSELTRGQISRIGDALWSALDRALTRVT